MKISKDYMLRVVSGNTIVVPVGEKAVNFNAIIHLQGSSVFIFKLLQENDYSLEQLVQRILEEYAVDEKTAYYDTKNFVDKLKEHHIIEE